MPAIQAIDVHAHYGDCKMEGVPELQLQMCSGGPQVVLERARLAGTCLTVVSPLLGLMPRLHGDPVAANADAARVAQEHPGIMQWVIVDPLKPDTYAQAADMLESPRCAGIKIHPEEHGYPIAEHGEALFRFAAQHGAVLQSHSGEQNSLPEDFVPFADGYPEVPVIVSHLGCGWDGDLTHQVRAIGRRRAGNIYTDTSSAKSITSGLLEWAVQEIGAQHILYGTDSPLYFAPMQRARVERAEITDEDKHMILRQNAIRVLKLGDIPEGDA